MNIPISKTAIQVYSNTGPLLAAMRLEFKELSKKKPDSTLSKAKVAIVNRLLKDLQELLRDEPNIKYLDLLSDEELPQYSDVGLILSQYEAAMRRFHSVHTTTRDFKTVWLIENEGEEEEDEESFDEDEDQELDDDEE